MTTSTAPLAAVAIGPAVKVAACAGAEIERAAPHDDKSIDEVIAYLHASPVWSKAVPRLHRRGIAEARTILEWLSTQPSEGWQQQWIAGGADEDPDRIDALAGLDSATCAARRADLRYGLTGLMLHRVVLPSYRFLATGKRWTHLYDQVRRLHCVEDFAAIPAASAPVLNADQIEWGIAALTKIMVHTGRDLTRLTSADVVRFRDDATQVKRNNRTGAHTAWEILRALGVLSGQLDLRASSKVGQRSTAWLVDHYGVRSPVAREILIRYLDERRPSVTYGTSRGEARVLAGVFWAEIERLDPGIDTLRLPRNLALQWKQRLATVTHRGVTRPRRERLANLATVRSMYLDIQEWALQDPSWAAYAAPSPVSRADILGMAKQHRAVTAEIHHRIRERAPRLPTLLSTASTHLAEQQSLLAAATAVGLGVPIPGHERTYRRTSPKYTRAKLSEQQRLTERPVLVEDLVTGQVLDLTRSESSAFWAWAVLETLRHTGVRIEELMDLTHLAVTSYVLPGTGETVPLLQIVPSKSNKERVLLVSPELASVLATIIARLRSQNGGQVPLARRYDVHDRTTGPALPHLFQHKLGWRWHVLSGTKIRRLINDTLTRSGLTNAAGEPLRYSPHDFRRIFATDAINGGLPIHIASKLLGHHQISTTQGYHAVFQDDLIRAYRTHLDQRRAARPAAEYRQPTDEEWREFQQHFELRKVELGSCGRPYGTPCNHEHACIRCPMLRVDPAQRHRLVEIARNLQERLEEAQANGWAGEVAGLTTSLAAARSKLTALDQSRQRTSRVVELGIPVARPPR